jgi:hypothetical protein
MHGGKTLRGAASPTWKGKGYSVHVPRRLADMLEQLEAVGDYVRMKEEIHLLRARLNEQCIRLDEGENPRAWPRFLSRLRGARNALAKEPPDVEDALTHLAAMEALASDSAANDRVWSQMEATMRTLVKLTDNERKVYEELNRTITPEAWKTFVLTLVGAVERNVSDRAQVEAVARDFLLTLRNHPYGDGPARVIEVAYGRKLRPPDVDQRHPDEDRLDELERQGERRVRLKLPFYDGRPQVRTIEQARALLREHPDAALVAEGEGPRIVNP